MALEATFDPVIQIGSSIAQGYPLPPDFDVSQAIKIEAQTSNAKIQGDTTQMQTLVQKVRALYQNTLAAPGAGSSEAAHQDAVQTSSQPAILASGGAVSRFNALFLRLAAFERVAFAKFQGQQLLTLALHLASNEIEARVTADLSGIGLPRARLMRP